MPTMHRTKYLALFLLAACKGPPPNVTVTSEAPASVAPGDFALDTVVGLLKSGTADGPALEAKINDPSTGIDNVDIDKDGKIDYITVVESQIPSGKKMELVAHPSGGQAPDTSIAAIKFEGSTGSGVDVQAGYAPLVDPNGQYYYHDSLAADLLFATWLFMPSRPYYVSYAPSGYAYRSRMAPAAFSQTRTTYQVQTRISPVAAAPRPATFNAARLTAPPRASATSFAQASQGTTAFKADARAKPSAAGFGASSPSPASRPAPSRPSPSRGKSK